MSNPPDSKLKTPVEYERPQGVAFMKMMRLLLLVTFVNTLLLAINLFGLQPWQFARQLYRDWSSSRAQAKAVALRDQQAAAAERLCRDFTFEPGHVVYTEVPDEAMRLIGAGQSYRSVLQGSPPYGWQTPAMERPPAPLAQLAKLRRLNVADAGTVFLHERTTPGGEKVLAIVALSAEHEVKTASVRDGSTGALTRNFTTQKTRMLRAATEALTAGGKLVSSYELTLVLPDTGPAMHSKLLPVEPGDRWREPGPATQPVEMPAGNRLRVFGGQVDPSQASRFTIPYELDGQAGVIDGTLTENGIILRPREGRMLPSSGLPRWELGR